VRIGSAIMIAPLRSATQIAEESAIVDILSGGRFELGLGSGYRVPEYEAFGADISKRIGTTEERVREVRRLLDENIVTPPPVQSPFPIWIGYGSPKGAHRAGLHGNALLSIDPRLAEPYREGLAAGGHPVSQGRMAGLVNVVVADDPERVWPRLAPHVSYQLGTYARYAVEGTGLDVPVAPTGEQLRSDQPGPDEEGVFPHVAVLTAEQTITLLRRRMTQMPIVDAFFWASFAGMPDDITQRHVELLSTVVRAGVRDD